MESFITAVHGLNPDPDFNIMDVITDRQPFINFFGFIKREHGKSKYGHKAVLTFIMKILGDMVLFTRQGKSNRRWNEKSSSEQK